MEIKSNTVRTVFSVGYYGWVIIRGLRTKGGSSSLSSCGEYEYVVCIF